MHACILNKELTLPHQTVNISELTQNTIVGSMYLVNFLLHDVLCDE